MKLTRLSFAPCSLVYFMVYKDMYLLQFAALGGIELFFPSPVISLPDGQRSSNRRCYIFSTMKEYRTFPNHLSLLVGSYLLAICSFSSSQA